MIQWRPEYLRRGFLDKKGLDIDKVVLSGLKNM